MKAALIKPREGENVCAGGEHEGKSAANVANESLMFRVNF